MWEWEYGNSTVNSVILSRDCPCRPRLREMPFQSNWSTGWLWVIPSVSAPFRRWGDNAIMANLMSCERFVELAWAFLAALSSGDQPRHNDRSIVQSLSRIRMPILDKQKHTGMTPAHWERRDESPSKTSMISHTIHGSNCESHLSISARRSLSWFCDRNWLEATEMLGQIRFHAPQRLRYDSRWKLSSF
jgi:hypothetical protein